MTWKQRLLRLVAFLRRYPGAIAAFGFVSGVASFVLVDRQAGFGRVIAIVMLVSWIWLVLESVVSRWFDARFGLRLPAPLMRYATQMIHQESLFFVLPFFLITTTWNSGQAVFTGLLLGVALVSILDPVYYKWLAPRRWVFLGYHTLTLFVVLLTALPIILQVPTAKSYQFALGAAVLLSIPSLAVSIPKAWWKGVALVGLTLALGFAGWIGRPWVPPPTLRITDFALATTLDRERRAPEERIKELDVTQLRARGLFAYTAINAPLGLAERVHHVWLRDGREVDRIALEITGGREAGYRAWSHKENFPADAAGRWQIRVLTDGGQMIGVFRFRVVAEAPPRVDDPSPEQERAREEVAPELPSDDETASTYE